MEVFNLRKSTRKNKKYMADVILKGKLYKNVHFGDARFAQYRDNTPLKLFSYLDHNDWDRKIRFYERHKHNNGPAAELSKEFLW